MIYEGELGSICFYWNDKLITSAPLSKYTQLKDYEKLSKSLIISGLKKGHNLDTQKVMYQVLIDKLSQLKRYKLSREDETQIGLSILCLIKLKIVDIDDVMMLFPKKRKFKRKNKNIS